MTIMARRRIGGRIALDRAGVAAYTGAAPSTVNHWHRHRARTGFPAAHTDQTGGEWFWLTEIKTFYAAHLAAKRAELTAVDRRGDPDELVTSGGAAKILGYRSYRNLPDALLDQPDRTRTLPDGRIRRYWQRRTVWAIADARTGRQSTGRPAGSTSGPHKPHPYADDPRLQAALDLLASVGLASVGTGQQRRGLGVRLAHQLGITERTAQRLLAAAAAIHSDAKTPPATPSRS
jgi:hypothetical protein